MKQSAEERTEALQKINVKRGKVSGEKHLAQHKARCPKRPRFTRAWYIAQNDLGEMLYVLWPITGSKKFKYIPYCPVV